MEEQYEVLLNHLKKVEGGKLHYNPKEKDVTNSYGIYRHAHPKAEIWAYIDAIATEVTRNPSYLWNRDHIDRINKLIDPKKELELTYKFYKNYFSGFDLSLLPNDLVLSFADCYVNTPLGASKAVQEALNDCYKYGLFKVEDIVKQKNGDLLLVDGKFGPTSKKALKHFTTYVSDVNNKSSFKDIIIFKNCMLMAMKTNYIRLGISNPSINLGNLNGWNNRMENAQHI